MSRGNQLISEADHKAAEQNFFNSFKLAKGKAQIRKSDSKDLLKEFGIRVVA